VICAGETWASIALRYELSVDELLDANESFISDPIVAGQEILIPELGEDDAAAEEEEAEAESTEGTGGTEEETEG